MCYTYTMYTRTYTYICIHEFHTYVRRYMTGKHGDSSQLWWRGIVVMLTHFVDDDVDRGAAGHV